MVSVSRSFKLDALFTKPWQLTATQPSKSVKKLIQEEDRLNSTVVLSVQRIGFAVEEFLAARSRHQAILNRLGTFNYRPPTRITYVIRSLTDFADTDARQGYQLRLPLGRGTVVLG